MMGRASAAHRRESFASVDDLNILGRLSGPAEPEKQLKQAVRCEKVRHIWGEREVLFIPGFFEGHGWRHTRAGQRSTGLADVSI